MIRKYLTPKQFEDLGNKLNSNVDYVIVDNNSPKKVIFETNNITGDIQTYEFEAGAQAPLKIVFIEGSKYGVVAESDYDTTIGNYTFTITFNRNLTESEVTDFTDTLTGIIDIEVMDCMDNRVYIRLPEGMIAGGDIISLSSPYYGNGDIPFINIFYNLPTFTSVLIPTETDPTFIITSGADFQHTYIPYNYSKIGGSIDYVNDGFVGNKFSLKKNNNVISSNISFRDNFLIYNFTSPVTFSVGDTIEFLYDGLTFDSFTVLDL